MWGMKKPLVGIIMGSDSDVPVMQPAVEICEAGGVAETRSITVRSVTGEKYDRITHHELGPIPPRLDGSDERDDGNLPECRGPEDDDLPF